MHIAWLFLTQVIQSVNNLLLCQSAFGTGLLLVGHNPLLKHEVVTQSHHMFEKGQAQLGRRVHLVISMTRAKSFLSLESPPSHKP